MNTTIADDPGVRTQLLRLLLDMPEGLRNCMIAAMKAHLAGEITLEQIEAARLSGDLYAETDPARFVERIRAAA